MASESTRYVDSPMPTPPSSSEEEEEVEEAREDSDISSSSSSEEEDTTLNLQASFQAQITALTQILNHLDSRNQHLSHERLHLETQLALAMSLSNTVDEATQREHLRLLNLEKKTLERDIAAVRSQIQALMAQIQAAAQNSHGTDGGDGDMEVDDHVNAGTSDDADDELDSEIWELMCGPDVQVQQTNRLQAQHEENMNENEDEDDLEIYEDDMDEEDLEPDEVVEVVEMDQEWMIVDTVVDDVVDDVEEDDMDEDVENTGLEEYDMMDDDESEDSLEEGEIREF